METDEINAALSRIEGAAGDYEIAHGMEDELRVAFIAHVAQEPTDPDLQAKAFLVLSSSHIHFPRYCA